MRMIYDRHQKCQRMMIFGLGFDSFVEHLEYVDALVGDDETFAACAVLDHHDARQPVHQAECVLLPFSYVISPPGRPLLQMQYSVESVHQLQMMAPKVDGITLGGGFPLGLTFFPIR